MRASLPCVLGLFLLCTTAGNAEEKGSKGALPIKAKLVAKKSTYQLDLGGLSAVELEAAVKEARKTGKFPPVAKVDLALELTNSTEKEIQIWHKGDPVVLTLDLKGPGALTAAVLGPMTLEFRVPEATRLAPGKSLTIPIHALQAGFRGATQKLYWTLPGEYSLRATLNTGISPAPKGAKEQDGFGIVAITTEPIKLTVEGK
jgi:hypothetical protein